MRCCVLLVVFVLCCVLLNSCPLIDPGSYNPEALERRDRMLSSKLVRASINACLNLAPSTCGADIESGLLDAFQSCREDITKDTRLGSSEAFIVAEKNMQDEKLITHTMHAIWLLKNIDYFVDDASEWLRGRYAELIGRHAMIQIESADTCESTGILGAHYAPSFSSLNIYLSHERELIRRLEEPHRHPNAQEQQQLVNARYRLSMFRDMGAEGKSVTILCPEPKTGNVLNFVEIAAILVHEMGHKLTGHGTEFTRSIDFLDGGRSTLWEVEKTYDYFDLAPQHMGAYIIGMGFNSSMMLKLKRHCQVKPQWIMHLIGIYYKAKNETCNRICYLSEKDESPGYCYNGIYIEGTSRVPTDTIRYDESIGGGVFNPIAYSQSHPEALYPDSSSYYNAQAPAEWTCSDHDGAISQEQQQAQGLEEDQWEAAKRYVWIRILNQERFRAIKNCDGSDPVFLAPQWLAGTNIFVNTNHCGETLPITFQNEKFDNIYRLFLKKF